ncbi:alpha/beta hydrolase, partial [Mesorhizobium sp. M8A.F.Ca.ET.023.02.2.1]
MLCNCLETGQFQTEPKMTISHKTLETSHGRNAVRETDG